MPPNEHETEVTVTVETPAESEVTPSTDSTVAVALVAATAAVTAANAEETAEQAQATAEAALATAQAVEVAPSSPSLSREEVAAIVRDELSAATNGTTLTEADVTEVTAEEPASASAAENEAPVPSRKGHPFVRMLLGRRD